MADALADPDPPSEAYPNCPVVDAHVHLFPTRVLEAIRKWFATEAGWTVPAWPAEEVVARITQRTDGIVFFPYAHKPGVARAMNDTAVGWQEKLDHAIGLGTVHAGDDDPARVAHEALAMGLHGIKLHCPVQGFAPDDPRLYPVYEQLADRSAPLVVHCSSQPFYRNLDILGPERLRRVLEHFPALRVCVPHIGLFETPEFLNLSEEYDVYFDTAVALGDRVRGLIGIRNEELPLERVRQYSDRLMFGSDYPITPINYETALRATANAFPQPHDAVFHRNAAEFFGIRPSS